MSEKVEGTPAVQRGTDCGAGAGEGQAGDGDAKTLANALRFEQAKNKVLLDEVVALEDELVNRFMGDFEAFVTDETREFWREQLLTNREPAMAALNDMARVKSVGSDQGAVGSGGRRPLHNRATARPRVRTATGSPATGSGQAGDTDDRAAKIRNRAQEISRAERVAFSAAFRRAEREFSGQ